MRIKTYLEVVRERFAADDEFILGIEVEFQRRLWLLGRLLGRIDRDVY